MAKDKASQRAARQPDESVDPHWRTLRQRRPALGAIRSREDLSCTRYDPASGLLKNWYVPADCSQSWMDNIPIGRSWIREIVELARHDPAEAGKALEFAIMDAIRFRGPELGHGVAFFGQLSQWALLAMIEHPDADAPPLPESLFVRQPPGRDQAGRFRAAASTLQVRW